MGKKNDKNKIFLKIILVFFIIALFLFIMDYLFKDVTLNIDLSNVLSEKREIDLVQKDVTYNLREYPSMEFNVFFCPRDDCRGAVLEYFDLANDELFCAFYDLNLMDFSEKLLEVSERGVNVSIVTDDEYLKREPLQKLFNTNIEIFSDLERGTRFNNYMHNKFCIIDEKYVLTGSANPTQTEILRNDNDVIIFESKYLARNFKNEFLQLSAGYFGYNKVSYLEYNNITLVFDDEEILISSYMCPQDNCDRVLIDILDKAEEEILFSTFVFTNNNFANVLKEKNEMGLTVKGVIESRSVSSTGTVYPELSNLFSFKIDRAHGTMHHKYFVVDGKYIVTGSMNPSRAGVEFNDENILVIENENLAQLYREQFYIIYDRN